MFNTAVPGMIWECMGRTVKALARPASINGRVTLLFH